MTENFLYLPIDGELSFSDAAVVTLHDIGTKHVILTAERSAGCEVELRKNSSMTGRLVLTRSEGESVRVTGPFVVEISRILGRRVRLAFTADKRTTIMRTELLTGAST